MSVVASRDWAVDSPTRSRKAKATSAADAVSGRRATHTGRRAPRTPRGATVERGACRQTALVPSFSHFLQGEPGPPVAWLSNSSARWNGNNHKITRRRLRTGESRRGSRWGWGRDRDLLASGRGAATAPLEKRSGVVGVSTPKNDRVVVLVLGLSAEVFSESFGNAIQCT